MLRGCPMCCVGTVECEMSPANNKGHCLNSAVRLSEHLTKQVLVSVLVVKI